MLVALLLMSGRPSRAADPRLDAARAHSQEGDSYYKLEKYANAITEYEQAYLAKPDPSFLYNIAQCHRLMGQGAEAIKFYRRFLKDAPTAPNRAVAEKHIRDLEDASPGPRPPPAPVRRPRRLVARDLFAPAAGRTGTRFGHPAAGAAPRRCRHPDLDQPRVQPTCTHFNAGVDDANRRKRRHLNTNRVPSDLF